MDKPLSGIRVLDLTRVLAGPYCTMILSDLGAEVIKIEHPSGGDDSRGFGPFLHGRSLYFLSINRAKKSVSLNLKSEKGKAILKALAAKCDIVVENFRPGTMERLGLGYETLRGINPRIIYAASSGFGHSGPYSEKPAYDILAQAMGGIMSITGWPDMPPTRVGMSLGDITASLFTAIGINAALYQRERSGMGQKIDVAMLDCQTAILENALVRFQAEGKNPSPIGNRHPTIAPFQAYKASDEHFVIAVGNDALWRTFCRAIERDDLGGYELFATNKDRVENLPELNRVLEPLFETQCAARWLDLFERHQIPAAPINKIDGVMKDEQLLARNMLVEVEDRVAGKIRIAGNPIKMDSVPESPTRKGIPEIGEHNREILTTLLGIDDAEVDILHAEGVI